MTNLLPPPSPMAAPLPPSGMANSATWWNRRLWKVPVWAWMLTALVIIGGAVSVGATRETQNTASPAVTAPQVTAPAPAVALPADCSGVACHMTKDSGIYGIPFPADAVQTGMDFVTSVGTLEEVTAFYYNYLTTHGWTFEPCCSELDPAVAETKSLGHVSDAVYCKPTSPILTVAVIVGNVGSGPQVELALVDDQGESSCP